jgi:hypothetical protein
MPHKPKVYSVPKTIEDIGRSGSNQLELDDSFCRHPVRIAVSTIHPLDKPDCWE